jgi:putative inorganic carbon (HCO3(-)) transporter
VSAARHRDAHSAGVVAARARPSVIPSVSDRFADAAALLLTVTIVGTAIAVDPGAASSFDAPKRLVALLGIASAAACLLAGGLRIGPRPTRAQTWVLAAATLAVVGTGIATLASPRAAIARESLRTLALYALAFGLGASRAVEGERRTWLLVGFLSAAAVNALASLLQVGGVALFTTVSFTGRGDTGAFLGNEGVLAQATALALVAALATIWGASTRGAGRGAALAASVLFVVTLIANRNLTSFVTAAGGCLVVLALARGRKALVPLAAALLVLAVGAAGYAPMRARLGEAGRALASGDWDALTTYRLGPWSAAAEMIRERPLLGFGPGSFGAEFATHRVQAELRQQRRLVVPLPTSSFVEAHSEYLQAAAEGGVPSACAAIVAAATLLVLLARVATSDADPRASEALLLIGVLGAAAVAALTWFPFQRPVTAVPLLLAAGRGWRLLASPEDREDVPPRRHALAAVAGILVLVAMVAPEIGRLAAEHRLATLTATLERVVSGGRIVPEAKPALTTLATAATGTADHDPADTRGLVAAGTAMLLAGDADGARLHYRAALARGERAEIDMNLARAYALGGRRDDAEAVLLRALWVAPALLDALPSDDRTRLAAALADRESRLRQGDPTAVPPAPTGE